MQNVVYIVYYDNGLSYEDHNVYVDKVYASKEDAHKYAEEMNYKVQHFTCLSKEEFTDEEYITYEQYYEMEYDKWFWNSSGSYSVREHELL